VLVENVTEMSDREERESEQMGKEFECEWEGNGSF